ncbi:hypothetical protein BD410DRAFT_793780 [Rickenella mellea]|uniref:DUF6533 domain-containing protein n=1 Tax=Rickenella mellea TaxID=50990 RepID=A0A4Y7PSQ8_9AGAM|nr:hypothetical protein BD410DRAFT_793780 [Rickenella mellea]
MSDSPPDIAGLIAQATQGQFANGVLVSATTLVFYDYALTFPTEMTEIWTSKFSGAQVLFFLTRYSYMVFTVFICVNNLTTNLSEMKGILTLRTYAIYQKNRLVLVVLGLTGVTSVARGGMAKPGVDSSVFGRTCGEFDPDINFRSQLTVLLAGNIISLILDVLVFTLTFAKTIRHAIAMRKFGLENGLGYFILRDGAAKLLFGVVGTIVFFEAVSNWLGVLVQISNPLTIILINRLVLNLRQVSYLDEGNARKSGGIGTIQEPVFATNSLLGNLGAQLRVGDIDEILAEDEAEVVEEREIVDHSEITEERRNRSEV